MGENTNSTGQPLYNQLLSLFEKEKTSRLSKNDGHDRYVKKLQSAIVGHKETALQKFYV